MKQTVQQADKRILVCEDEVTIRDFVVINLKRAGYEVVEAGCGEDALKAFDKAGGGFDIALLDIMMPGMDGVAVCKELRQKSPSIGIIMLSAKSLEIDKVGSLMSGADDYVTKPFSPSELIARVDAVYRRVAVSRPHLDIEPVAVDITSGPFAVNVKSRNITKNGQPLELTQVEMQILEFFIRNAGIALDRKMILNEAWGENYFGDEKIVDVNVRRLRMKIEDNPSEPVYIQTVWGFGYKWGIS